jgi:hypothetical protein
MTATLRAYNGGDIPCAKCRSTNASRPRPPTHLLTIPGQGSWPLCGAHAAQACHAHGIAHTAFNPTGRVST